MHNHHAAHHDRPKKKPLLSPHMVFSLIHLAQIPTTFYILVYQMIATSLERVKKQLAEPNKEKIGQINQNSKSPKNSFFDLKINFLIYFRS